MTQPDALLGMRLEDALAQAKALGLPEPGIITTKAPRGQRSGGTLRVVRVRENEWVVSAFLDGAPTE